MLVYNHTEYEIIFIALLCEIVSLSGLVLCHFIDVIFKKKLWIIDSDFYENHLKCSKVMNSTKLNMKSSLWQMFKGDRV